MDSVFAHQLGLFGEIDAEVVRARERGLPADLHVINAVERLLPNTTGYGQAGWYAELQQFLDKKCHRTDAEKPVQLPTYEKSLTSLRDFATYGTAQNAAPEARAETVSNVIVRNAVATAAAYPSMVLAKIDQIRNSYGPELPAPGAREAVASGSPPRLRQPLDILCALPDVGLAAADADVAALDLEHNTVSNLRPIAGTQFAAIGTKLELINERRDFVSVLADDLGKDLATKCLTCFGMLEEVDGQYCSTIYTDHPEPGLTVADVRRILNPRNWPKCCDFFHEVTQQDPGVTVHGWTRILETISPEPDDYLLKTALLFYYGEFDDGGIYLNYDVDPSKQDDSGLVEVDSGYIWVTKLKPDEELGVRIRTSKQERVNGLSPTATSALACHLGWGQISRDMLAGKAREVVDAISKGLDPADADARFFPFEVSPPQPLPEIDCDPPGPAPAHAHLPPNFGDTVRDGAALATDVIDRAATVWGRAATLWLDGLTRKDVTEIVSEVGTNAVKIAEAIYDTAADNVRPQFVRSEEQGDRGNG
ncbi:hypothetical protein BH10ACT9_BH10ACT9_46360 [soil metagenome]